MPTYPTFDGRTPLTKEVVNSLTSQSQAGSRRTVGTRLTLSDMGSLGASYAPDRGRLGFGIWAVLTDYRGYPTDQGPTTSVTTFAWKEVMRNGDGTFSDHPSPLTGDFAREPAVERLNRRVASREPVFLRRYVVELTKDDNPFPPWLYGIAFNEPPLPIYWVFDADARAEWDALTDVVPPTGFTGGSFNWHEVTMPGGEPVPRGGSSSTPTFPPGTFAAADGGVFYPGTYRVRDGKFHLFTRTGDRTNQVSLPWSNPGGSGNNVVGKSLFPVIPAGDPFYARHPGVEFSAVRNAITGLGMPPPNSGITGVTYGATGVLDLSGIDPAYNPSSGYSGPFPLYATLCLPVPDRETNTGFSILIIDSQYVASPRVVRLEGYVSAGNFTGFFSIFPVYAPLMGPFPVFGDFLGLGTWSDNNGHLIWPSYSGQFWMKYQYNVNA